MYAEFVMAKLDPKGQYFEKKFFHRDHCKQIGRHQVKDLGLVLKNVVTQKPEQKVAPIDDLNKIIIIDNLAESF